MSALRGRIMRADQNKGPIYGVLLYDEMPIGDQGMSQAFPGRDELEDVQKRVGSRTVAAFEVLTEHHRALTGAIERSGLDICPCKICGSSTVCIPDGLTVCKPCAQKLDLLQPMPSSAQKAGGQ